MKRNTPSLHLLLISLCLALAGCGGWKQEFSRHTLTFDDLERTYLLQTPEPGSTKPIPVILALHGGGGTARSMCAMPGGLAEPAKRAGFLLVCPEGIERHWNDGRDIQTWRAHSDGVDDVGFLMALIRHLSEQFPLDTERIFATGISNGGQMSYRLACEKSEAIEAIAAVAASMATSLDCDASEQVSVMVINGTEDPLVPYNGGEIKALRRMLGSVRSTDDVLSFWAAHNRCNLEAQHSAEPDLDPHDGTRIWRMDYEECAGDAHVIRYEIEGGGHTWPGANQYLPEFLIGRLSKDMQASEVIIEFFQNSGDPADS